MTTRTTRAPSPGHPRKRKVHEPGGAAGDGRAVIYGRQPVLETLRAGRRTIHRLLVYDGASPSSELTELQALADRARIPIVPIDRRRLDQMAEDGHHQGVIAEVDGYPYAGLQEVLCRAAQSGPSALVLLLDHVQDPQNLGSLLRSAEAAGVDGVLLPVDRAAGVSPAAVRASAGAAEHVRVVRVTNLVHTMKTLKEAGLWIAGLEATPDAALYTEADLNRGLGLVVGSEGQGLGRLVRETCDFLIRLPLLGRVGSLNAGVAGALALYEARRQQKGNS